MELLKELWIENGWLWMVGQGFGILAIILGFVSYQVKTGRRLLFMQSLVAGVFCIHYALIGGYTAMAMNAVNIFRNFIYDYRTRKGIESKLIPLLFVGLQVVLGFFTWEAWYSVFVLAGICINTYCMSLPDPQKIRKSILVTSPMVLVYDVFARSVGGTVYESVALCSAFIGILRNRKERE